MTVLATQSITSGASPITNLYCAGPVKMTSGSDRLVEISDLSVDFGLEVLKEGDSSIVYPTRVCLVGRSPRITFTTKDIAFIAAVGEGIEVTAFAGYFRKVASNGQRVAVGTASHVSMSGVSGIVAPSPVNLVHKQSGTASFTFTPVLSGASFFTISTTATIPTS